MLMDIWALLRPNRKIKARKSEEWIEIGFQVDDPVTDFRGAGFRRLQLCGSAGTIDQVGKKAEKAGRQAF